MHPKPIQKHKPKPTSQKNSHNSLLNADTCNNDERLEQVTGDVQSKHDIKK